MPPVEIRLTVNGVARRIETEPCRTLLALLREDLGLLSVKEGCGQGDCGACIVVMDGQAVNSCLVLAAQAEGAEIVTLEGLADGERLHPLQLRFIEHAAFQCGFCTPGMILSCYALLLANPQPDPQDIREAIAGNLCRCTSYGNIVTAVQDAAADLASQIILSAPTPGVSPYYRSGEEPPPNGPATASLRVNLSGPTAGASPQNKDCEESDSSGSAS